MSLYQKLPLHDQVLNCVQKMMFPRAKKVRWSLLLAVMLILVAHPEAHDHDDVGAVHRSMPCTTAWVLRTRDVHGYDVCFICFNALLHLQVEMADFPERFESPHVVKVLEENEFLLKTFFT